jgi:hypothetical protein
MAKRAIGRATCATKTKQDPWLAQILREKAERLSIWVWLV